jgi:hypothetical protein
MNESPAAPAAAIPPPVGGPTVTRTPTPRPTPSPQFYAGRIALTAAVIDLCFFAGDRLWAYFFFSLFETLLGCGILAARYRDYFRFAIALVGLGLSAEVATATSRQLGPRLQQSPRLAVGPYMSGESQLQVRRRFHIRRLHHPGTLSTSARRRGSGYFSTIFKCKAGKSRRCPPLFLCRNQRFRRPNRRRALLRIRRTSLVRLYGGSNLNKCSFGREAEAFGRHSSGPYG